MQCNMFAGPQNQKFILEKRENYFIQIKYLLALKLAKII